MEIYYQKEKYDLGIIIVTVIAILFIWNSLKKDVWDINTYKFKNSFNAITNKRKS